MTSSNRTHPWVSAHPRGRAGIWLAILCSLLLLGPVMVQAEDGPIGPMELAERAAAVVVGEGFDFASVEMGDPWDMNAITDIYNEQSQNVTSSAGANRLAIENGMLVGRTTSNDPQIFLKWPGYPGFQNAYPKYGINTPIDADRYRYLVMRMYMENPPSDGAGRLMWSRNENLTSPFGLSKAFAIQPGWFTYVLDLKTIGIDAGTEAWTGLFQALRLGPINKANVNFKIDWIRLVSETDLPTYTVPFQAQSGVVSLYAAPSNSQPDKSTVIATGLNAAAGSYPWRAGLMMPGDYYIYEVGGIDYAGLALGTPWNMTSANQYTLNQFRVNSASGGILNVTPTGNDPYISFTLDPNTLIDGNSFNRFAIKMNTSGMQAGRFYAWHIYWRIAGEPDLKSIDVTGRNLVAGENVYNVDMSGNADWAGKKIDYLRFDVLSNAPDTMASLVLAVDWAALTTGVIPSNEGQLTPTARYGADWARVQAAPMAQVTAPSFTSGADYATTVLGNAWDMDSANDIVATNEIISMNAAGGILTIVDDDTTNPGGTPPCSRTGDPQLYLRTGQYFGDQRTGIDPLRYRYLSFRFKEDHPTDTCLGSIARFIGWENSTADATEFEASVTNEGFNTYFTDLAVALVTPGYNQWNNHGAVNVFRFDPNEIPGKSLTGHLDYVTLTAKPWADATYTVQWNASSGAATTQVRIYRDADTNPTNGKTLIGTTTLGAGSYVWNTSALAPGNYYVYLEMDDGVNQPRGVYGKLPVTVKRQAAVTFTTPTRSTTVPEDFATKNGNAWDFADESDLNKSAPFPADGYAGLTNVSVNGSFNATSTSADPNLFLNMPGGAAINAGEYTQVRFRMFSGYAQGPMKAQFFWPMASGGFGGTDFIDIYPGWGLYEVNLQGNQGWSGNVQFLRMDPVAQAGVTFSIDWIQLTGPKSLNVAWTKQNWDANTRVSLQAMPATGGAPVWIARNQTGSSVAWDVAGLSPGEYTLSALVDDRLSAINAIPDAQKYTLIGAGQPLLQAPAALTLLAQVGSQPTGAIPINNLGGGAMNWTASSSQNWVILTKTSGSALFGDQIPFQVDARGLAAGIHPAKVTVDAGTGGTQIVDITVIVAPTIYPIYLPTLSR